MLEALIGAVIGSVITIISTIAWDNHKNKKRYNSLLKSVLFELRENQKRMNEVLEKLPKQIRDKIDKGDINNGVFFSDEEVSNLAWAFPKPYSNDAWKTFISSGFAINLPPHILQEAYKIYDLINSINFLGNLSVNIFQILAQQNRLDEETNKNFDRFCKFGTRSLEVIGSKTISNLINEIDKIIK